MGTVVQPTPTVSLDPAAPLGPLPYGGSLHYVGCGCPLGWAQGAPRAADLADRYVEQAFWALQQGALAPLRTLRVLFCLPHHNVTGGMKVLVEHIRLLRERGHWVGAVLRSDSAQRALPPWASVEADADVVCGLTQRMDEACAPYGPVDAVVVGIFHQVAELLLTAPAPILYFEQGHEWLFGDPVRLQEIYGYRAQDQLFHRVMHLPCALGAVSEAVRGILAQEFGRAALVLHNFVDCERFAPGPRASLAPSKVLAAASCTEDTPATPGVARKPSVLLVGNPALPLKGFSTAVSALSLVNQIFPIEVVWICQTEPTEQQVPSLKSSGLKICLHINPSQDTLSALYRGHDCFLFTSHYEAWGMPALEAMASGLAVVTTSCLGVGSFARPGSNCLMAAPQDTLGLAHHVLSVLRQPGLKQRLQAAARQTAQLFSPESAATRMEAVLYSLSSCSHQLLQLRSCCALDIQLTASWASHACSHTPQQAQLQPQRLLWLGHPQLQQQWQRQMAGHGWLPPQQQPQQAQQQQQQQWEQQQGLVQVVEDGQGGSQSPQLSSTAQSPAQRVPQEVEREQEQGQGGPSAVAGKQLPGGAGRPRHRRHAAGKREEQEQEQAKEGEEAEVSSVRRARPWAAAGPTTPKGSVEGGTGLAAAPGRVLPRQ